MFRPIWPSSGVKIIFKIALKTAALFHLRFLVSSFRSIVHWSVLGVSCHLYCISIHVNIFFLYFLFVNVAA
jgi:hypothetical protein